jgi:hypothetical protein
MIKPKLHASTIDSNFLWHYIIINFFTFEVFKSYCQVSFSKKSFGTDCH